MDEREKQSQGYGVHVTVRINLDVNRPCHTRELKELLFREAMKQAAKDLTEAAETGIGLVKCRVWGDDITRELFTIHCDGAAQEVIGKSADWFRVSYPDNSAETH